MLANHWPKVASGDDNPFADRLNAIPRIVFWGQSLMRIFLRFVWFTAFAQGVANAQPADLILAGARVWTGDSLRPRAEAVAVRGDRIVAVGTREVVMRHRGTQTRVLELRGRFIAPGFIDNHTHFQQAGALILGVNLLDVASPSDLVRRVREARDRLPEGAWLTGGDWGAYEAWAQSSAGRDTAAASRAAARLNPDRSLIDSITPRTHALLSRW